MSKAFADDYEDGLSSLMKNDLPAAFVKFQKAAKNGDQKSQFMVSVLYDTGKGTTQNLMSAYIWASIAAVNGDKVSIKNRDQISNKMTPQQVEQAQRLARECVASNFKKCD